MTAAVASRQLPVLALVGRPNVGKSSLFNRLTASRDALVADQPGVTRDRQYGYAESGGRRYIVIDTGGIGQDDETIDEAAQVQTDLALDEADAVIFLTDARQGAVAADTIIATRLRRLDRPVFVAANKSEGLGRAAATAEFHALGLGEPWAISAQRGDHVAPLLEQVLDELGATAAGAAPEAAAAGIRLALIGRPNAGKSTLVNRLLGEQRMLALDEPGTTRDAVASDFSFAGEPWTIVDTAGIRRRARVRDHLERISIIKAMQAAEQADVVILMLDAQSGLSAQDARLLALVQERGRAAVIALNKWDGLSAKQRQQLHRELRARIGAFDYLPLCFISALHGTGLRNLLAAAKASHAAANAELPTPDLARVLAAAVQAHAPPAIQGRRIKLRYAHQGGRNPPTIVIHGNQTQRLSDEYKRYLIRRFREAFDLFGTPITLVLRNSRNPYAREGGRRKSR
ncbi:MAG TPA: ribosome biogenesis GTPase Der [Salinisphaeraceae bacterium]|nr:ribosome biogenesis GTPase Der [Salinisphaeraceae bacterium]